MMISFIDNHQDFRIGNIISKSFIKTLKDLLAADRIKIEKLQYKCIISSKTAETVTNYR
jgi:hypothetical protein